MRDRRVAPERFRRGDGVGDGSQSLLPLGGPARDRRSAEVLRGRADEPPARRRDRAHRQRRRARRASADNAWLLVATTESDLLPTLSISNKRSQSFYAEQIFKTLAFEKTGKGSWEGALTLARQFLTTLGLDPARFDLHDGSGLSANNRVSAGDLVSFLEAMNTHPQGAVWRSTLAVSGEADGSLRGRLLDSRSRGQVEAKTGTLNGVSTLAGYAQAGSGKTYAFAILLNGPGVSESRGHAYQDRLVRTLDPEGVGDPRVALPGRQKHLTPRAAGVIKYTLIRLPGRAAARSSRWES